jgi:GNAT superfamily N-acetyltransferase
MGGRLADEADESGEVPVTVCAVVGLGDARARLLEEKHRAELGQRYGGEGPGPLASEDFEPPAGCFVVALLDGVTVGCGGFRRLVPTVAEIKRMYVDTGARGRGVGRHILRDLEERARAAGYTETWLETGTEQPEALALYESVGYEPIVPYGEFKHDDRCRCFSRAL